MIDEKVRRIGSGTFGKVFLVEHKKTKKKFAMKSISKPVTEGERLTFPDWHPELELSELVDSEYVVKIIEVYETADEVHLIMELCERDLVRFTLRLLFIAT
jgi:serine/threonine protein kinase